ncbi:hypothetical protein PoB_004921900 [Plakobranchus ocellatus]|uniref:Uncharacterized protein n=1 Tax=Plakobranchus ocellatus TaxID=259542 RepID=A0AAV4BRB8_9GAST|nr:hypothetical protein PoB_004921900 [Plakobranchus ocellatus]
MRATIFCGTVSALLAAFVDLKFLIELVLIGTMLGYVIVTFAVIFIRYVEIEAGGEKTPLINIQKARDDAERREHYGAESSTRGGTDTSAHRRIESHSRHTPKLRLSDSETSDDDVFDPQSFLHTTSTSRPRSRSTSDKHEVLGGAIGSVDSSILNIPSLNNHIRRHSDNAAHPNDDLVSDFDSSKNHPAHSTVERSRSSYSHAASKVCLPVVKPLAYCLSLVARFMCDGRHISDFLKLLMILSRKQITVLLLLLYMSLFMVCVVLGQFSAQLTQGQVLVTVLFTLAAGVAVITTALLIFQPQLKRYDKKCL